MKNVWNTWGTFYLLLLESKRESLHFWLKGVSNKI